MIKKLFINFIIGVFLLNISANADKLQTIKKKGVLKVGVNTSIKLFAFKSRTGRLGGFEIDLAKKIAKELKVKIKFVEINDKNKFKYLSTNKIDILLGTSVHTVKRDKDVDFSISYFYDGQAVLSRNNSVAKSYKDYSEKSVAAVKNSTSGAIFEVIQPFAKVVYFDTLKEAVKALNSKKVDGVTANFGLLNSYAKFSKGKLKMVGKKFTLEPYGIVLNENESNLRDEINFSIQNIVKVGEYNRIYKKWFNLLPDRKPILWP